MVQFSQECKCTQLLLHAGLCYDAYPQGEPYVVGGRHSTIDLVYTAKHEIFALRQNGMVLDIALLNVAQL